MELYLQFGYGMKAHCEHLLSRWGQGTVILSPRDLEKDALTQFGQKLLTFNGRVLVDPQFYLPHASHERLRSHDFWPGNYETGVFWQGEQLSQLLVSLIELNEAAGATELIVPGLLAAEVNDDWLRCQASLLEGARRQAAGRAVIPTVALSADAVRNDAQMESLLDSAERWGATGYYLVCEHPRNQYLVDDVKWLLNVLDVIAGLRLLGAAVIVGYCSHQMLIADAVGVTAICSGTWQNVRGFQSSRFEAPSEDPSQRATWYYCAQAFTEYKLPSLDVAQTVNLLDRMQPAGAVDGGYSRKLFEGRQPTASGFREQDSFRHYLYALHAQASVGLETDFDSNCSRVERDLTTAGSTIAELTTGGIRGQQRDFGPIVDVNLGALAAIKKTRGAILRRRWADLS